MYYGVLALTVSTILVAVLGIVASKRKTCPFTFTFGLLSFLSFLAFLLSGGLLLGAAFAGAKQIDVYCN